MPVSMPYREKYLKGIEKLISDRQYALAQKRREYCKDIFKTPEKYREDLRRMLGYPLVDHVCEIGRAHV